VNQLVQLRFKLLLTKASCQIFNFPVDRYKPSVLAINANRLVHAVTVKILISMIHTVVYLCIIIQLVLTIDLLKFRVELNHHPGQYQLLNLSASLPNHIFIAYC
jgi:hypothetical protein